MPSQSGKHRATDHVWLAVAERPWILGLAIAAALILLPVAVWLDLRNLSDAGLAAQARTLNAMVSEIRGYYGSQVVARVQGFKGESLALHNYEDVEGAIPIPATLSLELGDVIAARGGGNVEYRFVSDAAFANRAPHRLDAFERKALAQFRESREADDIATQFSGSLFQREVRMAVPVMMGQACVSCHNTHPESPKRDWQVGDVRGIQALLEPWVQRRVLLGKDLVVLFESVQQFTVAEDADGNLIGCGALHVMWDDLGEIRTLIVADEWLHHGVGRAIVDRLEENARALGLRRLFCLTFEVEFFSARGFEVIGEQVVDPDVYSQLIRSPDEGVAEFLDLAHVKPNTLGNTRMLKTFD